MKAYPSPTCPACHGSGEIEHRVHYLWQGQPAELIEYEPCPCTAHRAFEPEEDWSK